MSNDVMNLPARRQRVAITIPVVATTPGSATLLSALITAASSTCPLTAIRGIKILGTDAAGTARAAFVAALPRANTETPVATDFTTHGQYVAAGAECPEQDLGPNSHVRAVAASTITAVCVIYYNN